MRILMLSAEYPPNMVGGLGKHVESLSHALAALGIEVVLVTPRDRGGVPEETPAEGLTVYRIEISPGRTGSLLSDTEAMNGELLRAAEEIIARTGPVDLIHAHDWLVASVAKQLKHLWHAPLLVTIHATERGRYQGELPSELSRKINEIEDDLIKEAWRVIVTSYFMAHELVAFFGTSNDKLDVIPNAVSTAPYDCLSRPELTEFRRQFAADDETIVFYVGRVVYEKGLQVLVAASPQVLTYSPKTKFVIAGRGPMADELRLQADRLGVGQRFYFTGYINDEDRDKLFVVSDVAAFPSLYEPFGIVALEAMAARVPVVVSAVGGLTEVVENHVTGILAVPNNPDSLAWAVIHTLSRPDWSVARVENAYRRVIEQFSWPHVAQQKKAIYERVVKECEQDDWCRDATKEGRDG
ncbi:MAG: glycosyltransferase family 4 protein [Anaerolineae bacterium]